MHAKVDRVVKVRSKAGASRRLRRAGLALAVAAAVWFAAGSPRFRTWAAPARPAGDSSKYLVYIGTYTDHGSKGIYLDRFDAATGAVESLGLAAEAAEPSFLAIDRNRKFIYAVNEMEKFDGQPTGAVSAFSRDAATGKLSLINEVASHGPDPAHVAIDPSGKYVFAANFNGGNIAVFPILANGGLGSTVDLVQHYGSGPNREKQLAPHTHETVFSPDHRFAIVADFGVDQVFAYPFDASTGKLGREPKVFKAARGSAPRHVTFSRDGKMLYVLCELSSTLDVLSYRASDASMALLQTVPIETNNAMQKWAGELQIDRAGRFLYASNRGDDFLAVYSIDPQSGFLTRIQTVPSQGKTPRFFTLDPTGHWLWDANQDSSNIVLFRVDPQTGELSTTKTDLKIPSPSCVLFVPAS
jgi:6-phosphogluconolactonase